MKKILIVVGAIFIVLILILALVISAIATKGAALDKESKQYADTAIVAIVSNWDKQQLLERASPELVKSIDAQGTGTLDALFQQWQRFGNMAKFGGSKGEAYISLNLGAGKSVTGMQPPASHSSDASNPFILACHR